MINKFLCKYFDKDNKGYVTVENIVGKILAYFISIVIVILFVYFVYRGVLFIVNNDIYDKDIPNMIGFFGVMIIGTSIVIFVVCLWSKVAGIKVAKCERINK